MLRGNLLMDWHANQGGVVTIFVAHAMESGLSSGWVRHWAWVQALPYHLEWKIMFVLILRLLQVESPIICPLLEKMDEHGLFVVENLWKKNPSADERLHPKIPANFFLWKYKRERQCLSMKIRTPCFLGLSIKNKSKLLHQGQPKKHM